MCHSPCVCHSVENIDFLFNDHRVTFQPEAMTATVEVVIMEDAILEPTESFSLLLEVPQSTGEQKVTVGVPAEATVNILDNDSASSAVAVPSESPAVTCFSSLPQAYWCR